MGQLHGQIQHLSKMFKALGIRKITHILHLLVKRRDDGHKILEELV